MPKSLDHATTVLRRKNGVKFTTFLLKLGFYPVLNHGASACCNQGLILGYACVLWHVTFPFLKLGERAI